nr:MAG TPA: hypothetical protein [Caudoviricetes sp.]
MPIDFSWFYFIGHKKLCLNNKEIGRLTITTFNKLYKHYKDDFDYELLLKTTNTTYEKAHQDYIAGELW